jgi:hypothetical protein
MVLTLTLPQSDWQFPLGTRVPIAGSLGVPAEGIAPDALLIVAEQALSSKGQRTALGNATIKLVRSDDVSFRFFGMLKLDGRVVPPNTNCELA